MKHNCHFQIIAVLLKAKSVQLSDTGIAYLQALFILEISLTCAVSFAKIKERMHCQVHNEGKEERDLMNH